jgi:hypothetical protein
MGLPWLPFRDTSSFVKNAESGSKGVGAELMSEIECFV